MSYTYRSTGKGIDLIVATQKGIKEGGMPKGAIIPSSYKYIPETSHNVYAAKHSDKENVLTHIQSEGIVNRFGWYITDMDVLSVKPNWTLDVGGPGWFRRVTVNHIKEIEKYI